MKKFISIIMLSLLLVSSLCAAPQDLSWWNKSTHAGSRKDPTELRTYQEFVAESLLDRFYIRMGISGIVRGEAAYRYCQLYDKFLQKPKAGNEYIMIYVYLDLVEDYSGNDKPMNMDYISFKLLNTKGSTLSFDNTYARISCSDKLAGEVYEGGEAEGFLIFQVPIGMKLTLRVGEEGWFDLGTTSAFADKL